MFLHARKGHVEPLGKGCNRSVRAPELLQNAASGGVRERAERGIEVGLAILYHTVQYGTWVTALQWEAERPLRCPGDPPRPTINGVAFIGEGKLSSRRNWLRTGKTEPRYPVSGSLAVRAELPAPIGRL